MKMTPAPTEVKDLEGKTGKQLKGARSVTESYTDWQVLSLLPLELRRNQLCVTP
jgi:hypothetical protein